MSSLDLNALLVFKEVAQARSFTTAARTMGMPSSTVSRIVARLEKQLGVTLLQRTTRTVALTDAGATYLVYCEQLAGVAGEAALAMRGLPHLARGPLRIGAPIEFGRTMLSRALPEFCRRHPEVRPCVLLTNRYVRVVEEGFDLVVRTGALVDSTLHARRLGRSSFVAVASRPLLARVGQISSPDDLSDLPTAAFGNAPGDHRWTMRRGNGKPHVIPLRPVLVTNDLQVLRQAAIGGTAIAVLPHFVVARDLADGRAVRILETWLINHGEVHAVFSPSLRASLSVRSLCEILSAQIAKTPGWEVARGTPRQSVRPRE